MRTLIENTTVLAMDDVHGAEPFQADVLLDGQHITAVGPDLEAGPVDDRIDGRNHLVMPGLINAHMHSWETFFRGR